MPIDNLIVIENIFHPVPPIAGPGALQIIDPQPAMLRWSGDYYPAARRRVVVVADFGIGPGGVSRCHRAGFVHLGDGKARIAKIFSATTEWLGTPSRCVNIQQFDDSSVNKAPIVLIHCPCIALLARLSRGGGIPAWRQVVCALGLMP